MAQAERVDSYRGMRGIRRLHQRIGIINSEVSDTVYPGLPWPEGNTSTQIIEVSKQINPLLRENLRAGNWHEADIDQFFAQAEMIQAEYARAGKPFRNSGEDTIYHSLRIALHLTFMGITDKALIEAALWHDVKEDLDALWDDSKNSLSSEVVHLVDAVTGVKSRRIEANTATEEEKLVNDELATVIHLYEAALIDPRAILLKEEDVNDNARTYDSMPVNTNRQKMKKNRKIQRFLRVFYDLLRKTHGPILANKIAETSLELQFPEKFAQIQRMIANEQREFSEITGRDAIEFIQERSAQLEAESYKPNESRLPLQEINSAEVNQGLPGQGIYYNVVNPDFLAPPVISVQSRDIVALYRENYHPDLLFTTLPFIKIICRNENEKAYWLNYLTSMNRRSNIITDDEDVTHLTIPLTSNGQPGSDLEIEVELSTIESEILPIDEYRATSAVDPWSHAVQRIASDKMARITDAYRKAKLEDDPSPAISERFKQGSVDFFTPDNELFTVPQGATYLDAVSVIGKNLPIATIAITVLENGQKKLVSLGDSIKPGQQIEAITQDMIIENPSLLDTLYSMTSGDEKLIYEIEEMSTGFSPTRYDFVTTDRARRLISNRLKASMDDESTKSASRRRARRITARLYQLAEEQQRRFDQFIKDGFYGVLEEKYGTLDTLLEQIGQLQIPLRDEFIDHLEKPELTFKIDKDTVTIEALKDLNLLVNNLLEFRKKLPTVNINGVPNQYGVLKTLGEILERYQFDVLPMRASAVDEDDDGIIKANIELVLRHIDPSKVESFLTELRQTFATANIQIQYPRKKSQNK